MGVWIFCGLVNAVYEDSSCMVCRLTYELLSGFSCRVSPALAIPFFLLMGPGQRLIVGGVGQSDPIGDRLVGLLMCLDLLSCFAFSRNNSKECSKRGCGN